MKSMEQWKSKGMKLWSWVQKNYICVLICVNVLFLVCALAGYYGKVTDKIKLEYTEEQMRSINAENCVGGRIDENSKSGLYDIIPDMFLKKGYYSYTVEFEGESASSFCWPHTYDEFFKVIDQEVVYLGENKFSNTRKFWLNADLSIALRLYYSGEGEVTFTDFSIEETNALANIELFKQLLLLAGINLVVFLAIRFRKKPLAKSTKYTIIALLTLGVIANFPAMNGYLMDGHDLSFHLMRIEGIKEAFLSGQFPVRISPVFHNGYGYANSIFYGEVLLYFPGILRTIGFTVAQSYNAYLALLNILTIVIAYYCSKKIIKDDFIAVTVTALYTLCPYRLVDLYTRAAIGEVTAMAFLPLVVYGLYRILAEDTDSKKYGSVYLTLTIGLTGIIQSHVLTVEMVAGFILLACVVFCFRVLQKRRFLALVKTVIATLLLNIWFLVPFVDFMLTQNIVIFNMQKNDLIQSTGLYFTQLFSMFSDYAVKNLNAYSGVASEMFFSMGITLGLGMVLFVAMFGMNNAEEKKAKKQGLCFLAFAVLATWMTTVHFPWDKIATMIPMARTLIASIQFVWRFMAIAAVLAAVVTGFGLYLLQKEEGRKVAMVVASVFISLSVIMAMDFFQINLFNKAPLDIDENTFFAQDNYPHVSGGEYALGDAKYEILTEEFDPRAYGGVEVTAYEKQGTDINITVENDGTEGYVLLPLLNYKGYSASSEDGVITKEHVQTGENAVVRVNIPANYKGTISVFYQGFWYWRVAEVISLLAAGYCIYAWRKSKRNKFISNQE